MKKKNSLELLQKQGALLALIVLVAVAAVRFPVFRQSGNNGSADELCKRLHCQ